MKTRKFIIYHFVPKSEVFVTRKFLANKQTCARRDHRRYLIRVYLANGVLSNNSVSKMCFPQNVVSVRD